MMVAYIGCEPTLKMATTLKQTSLKTRGDEHRLIHVQTLDRHEKKSQSIFEIICVYVMNRFVFCLFIHWESNP